MVLVRQRAQPKNQVHATVERHGLEVELERRFREHVVGAGFREVLSDLRRVKAVHLKVKGEAVPPRVVKL